MTLTEVPELIPARMLNEYAYCPHLFFLEWVDQLWADSADMADGDCQHRRADAGGGAAPLPAEGTRSQTAVRGKPTRSSCACRSCCCETTATPQNVARSSTRRPANAYPCTSRPRWWSRHFASWPTRRRGR